MPALGMAALRSSTAEMPQTPPAIRDYADLRASMTITVVTEVGSRCWIIRLEFLLTVGLGTRRSGLTTRNCAPDDRAGRQGAQRGSGAIIAMPAIAPMPAVIPSPKPDQPPFNENFGAPYAAKMEAFLSTIGLPCQAPPWATLPAPT